MKNLDLWHYRYDDDQHSPVSLTVFLYLEGDITQLQCILLNFHSFVHYMQAISIVPLQVQSYSEALSTQHKYCVGVNKPKRHRQLRLKDLPKAPTWRLERDSNPRSFGRKATNLPIATTPHTLHVIYGLCKEGIIRLQLNCIVVQMMHWKPKTPAFCFKDTDVHLQAKRGDWLRRWHVSHHQSIQQNPASLILPHSTLCCCSCYVHSPSVLQALTDWKGNSLPSALSSAVT